MKKKDNHSRRGVAIEMAIGVMFVMVALSILLLTYWTLENRIEVSDLDDFHEKVATFEVYDIGECGYKAYKEYITADSSFTNGTFKIKNEKDEFVEYTVKKVDNSLQIIDGETIILTIVLGEDNSITSWK